MAKKKAGKKKAAKPKKEAKRKGKEKQVYTKMLRVDLTPEEQKTAADAMARAVGDLRAIEADKKKVVDDFKAKEAACHAALVTNANLVRDGYDMRDVSENTLQHFLEIKATAEHGCDITQCLGQFPLLAFSLLCLLALGYECL